MCASWPVRGWQLSREAEELNADTAGDAGARPRAARTARVRRVEVRELPAAEDAQV